MNLDLIKTLESTANTLFNNACTKKDDFLFLARQDMAISWGFNRYLERVEFMTLCTKYLQHLGLDKDEIRNYQGYGFEVALRTITILESINKQS